MHRWTRSVPCRWSCWHFSLREPLHVQVSWLCGFSFGVLDPLAPLILCSLPMTKATYIVFRYLFDKQSSLQYTSSYCWNTMDWSLNSKKLWPHSCDQGTWVAVTKLPVLSLQKAIFLPFLHTYSLCSACLHLYCDPFCRRKPVLLN